MIKHLWVIFPSGTCAIQRKYGIHEYKEPLLSSTIASIFNFTRFIRDNELFHVKLSNGRIFYKSRSGLTCVVLDDGKSSFQKIFSVIEFILSKEGDTLNNMMFCDLSNNQEIKRIIDEIDEIVGEVSIITEQTKHLSRVTSNVINVILGITSLDEFFEDGTRIIELLGVSDISELKEKEAMIKKTLDVLLTIVENIQLVPAAKQNIKMYFERLVQEVSKTSALAKIA